MFKNIKLYMLNILAMLFFFPTDLGGYITDKC